MIYKSSRIRINDEGALQGYVRAMDFVGSGVTASVAAGIATITIAGSAPSWHGNIVASMGNGDPQKALEGAIWTGSNAPTPTQITTTVARISYFVLPANITVNTIRFYGTGTVAGIYHCAIYNGDTLARLTADLEISTTLGAWGSVGSSLALTLTAGQLYFMAVSVDTTGTTAGLMCLGTSLGAPPQAQITVLPKSWPGNLDIDSKFVTGAYAQFAVTAGALPDPAATIVTQGAWTGGMPLFFLDNNNA